MPNKSIYIPDEELPLFQKAQEIAGESLSKVITEALRLYVSKKDMERRDFKEIIVMKGHEDVSINSSDIKKSRFIGRLLSDDNIDETSVGGKLVKLAIYETAKSKFVLRIEMIDIYFIEYDFKIYEDINSIPSNMLTAKMMLEIEKTLGTQHIAFIDI